MHINIKQKNNKTLSKKGCLPIPRKSSHWFYRARVLVFGSIVLLSALQVSNAIHAKNPPLPEPFSKVNGPAKYVGEKLSYVLSFFLFSEAATCQTYLKKIPGGFEGIFVAETKGFLGWMTSYRKYVYNAKMRLIDDGKTFQTYYFSVDKKIGSEREITEEFYDYDTNSIRSVNVVNGKRWEKNFKIPKGVLLENIISGFYNFRSQKNGELREGMSSEMRAFVKDKYSVFKIHAQSKEEKRRNSIFSKNEKQQNMVLRIKIAKEIFGNKEGLLYALLNREHLPIKVVIEDVLVFGDVVGTLSRRL